MKIKKQTMEMVLEKIEGKYLMRDDKITYELRKYNLSEISQKFLFGIMYKISADFIKPFETNKNEQGQTFIYKISFDELKEEINLDYRIESLKPKINKLLKELISTPIEISVFDENKKRKELVNTNLIEKIVLSDLKDVLYISIDERLLPLYRATADKFTLWHFDYIVLSEKKYTPRLYEYLVEFAKSIGTKNIDNIISKTVDIDVLRYELSIPNSYQYSSHIKTNILEESKKELLGLTYENSEEYKLFKSFEYIENYKRSRKAGRRPVESITFNFELLEKTKKLLRGNKGEEATNEEKIEKRAEEKSEFYYTVGNITARCEKKNTFISKLTETLNDFTLRVLDMKNDVRDNLNLSEIQDVAFERALIFTLENLKTADIEEFEYNFRINLEKNIDYWKNRTGKGNAKPKKD